MVWFSFKDEGGNRISNEGVSSGSGKHRIEIYERERKSFASFYLTPDQIVELRDFWWRDVKGEIKDPGVRDRMKRDGIRIVKREDVTLTEEVDRIEDMSGSFRTYATWFAALNGPASTGERVEMSRVADHAGEALLLLTEALKEEGYELQ
ncbi:MAG: hypothetical protein Tp182DCM212571_66 [Prokaryotic dsDNA virus sp.]|jgi:hypothetical protein|nr:MAG: hypothetical protein Tp182DCM212571_66 [Prokaryotic dsDNA virus sp.]|tara:strand:- start:38714 stop:39163 length:450 start_codon:yes stop_codon:yes gene_type:complete